jgi:hypothetical protein
VKLRVVGAHTYRSVAVSRDRWVLPPCRTFFFCFGSDAKHFQKRRVSSAAPNTTVEPSGGMAGEREENTSHPMSRWFENTTCTLFTPEGLLEVGLAGSAAA